MTAAVAVHQCLFCPQEFHSATAKDDHILEHFAQELCSDCNQSLIRIGSHLYTLHDAVTCVKRGTGLVIKTEPNIELCNQGIEFPCENRYDIKNDVNTSVVAGFEEVFIKIEPSFDEQEQTDPSGCIVIDFDHVASELKIEPDDKLSQKSEEIAFIEPIISEKPSDPNKIDEITISIILCDVCGQSFNSEPALENHKQLSHVEESIIPDFPSRPILSEESPMKRNDCEVCGQPFDCELFLESHKKLKHGSNAFKRPQNKAPETNSRNSCQTSIIELKCNVCGQLFDSESYLESHKQLKHSSKAKSSKAVSRLAEKSQGIDSKRLKMEANPSKKFECIICYKMYSSETSLRTHVETIHDPSARKFPCSLCGMAFYRECALQVHHEKVHLDLKNFACSVCDVRLKSKKSLESHMFIHSGKKPIECLWEGCKKRFSCTSNRDEHLRSHTGEKPFQCTIKCCDKRFAFAADFRRHKYVVHNIFTKKFPCDICSQVFPENALLKKHVKTHEVNDK